MIPATLFTLVVGYLVLYWLAAKGAPSRLGRLLRPEWTALALALAACAVELVYLGRSPHRQKSTEIAWTGLETAKPGTDLEIGASGGEGLIGWPTGAFAPHIRFSASAPGQLEIRGGAGFIRTADARFLNGKALPLNQPVDAGSFRVTLERSYFLLRELHIRRVSDNEELARLRVSRGDRDRVVDMATAVNPSVVKLRSARQRAKAGELEGWATGLRLLIPESGDLRILDRDQPYSPVVALPATLTVLWTNRTLPFQVKQTSGGGLAIDFPPPWRMSSPLPPPPGAGGAPKITFTGEVRPGDLAFLLPLGQSLAHFRQDVPLENGKFASCVQEARPGPYAPQTAAKEQPWEGITCMQTLNAGSLRLRVATVEDLPRLGGALWISGIAVALLGLGLRVTMARMRAPDRWVICGIVLTLWMLLVFRCHLAFLYALDPSYLDRLAVGGVTKAAMALATVPGLVLLVAPLWRDQYFDFKPAGRNRAALELLGYALALAVGAVVQAVIAARLWPNTPGSYSMAGSVLGLGALVFGALAAFAAFFFYIVFQYVWDPQEHGGEATAGLSKVLNATRAALIGLLLLPRRSATSTGAGLWESLKPDFGPARPQVRLRNAPEGPPPVRGFWWRFRVLAGFIVSVLIVVYGVVYFDLAGTAKWVQEIAGPMLLCWVPACLLLSARKVFAPGAAAKISLTKAGAVIGIILLVSVFAFPFAAHDLGGMVATLAVFLPVALLLAAGGRPWPVGGLPLGVLALAFGLASLVYMKFNVVIGPAAQVGQTASARILAFKHGLELERYLVWSHLAKEGDTPLPVNFRRLKDAMEHSQENRMMAHEGGYFGLGFGNAPTRLSRVRQDTLQFDSTFAFFVVGESGWLGGVCLLLLYAVPLALVLISARPVFDVGHGLAAVVASAFVLAALVHAGMNLGALPFTGRNLPLLSVSSLSDLVLWTLLFSLAVQAVLWRTTGHATIFRDVDSLVTTERAGTPRAVRAHRVASAALAALPAILFVWVAMAGLSVARDRSLAKGFDWGDLLESVNDMASRKQLWFDRNEKIIKADRPIPPDSLLGQEIEAFNALPDQQKIEGSFVPPDYDKRLRKVTSVQAYDRFLADLRWLGGSLSERQPSLFEVSPPDEWADLDDTLPAVDPDYKLAANPAYNSRVSFRTGIGQESFPRVALRDGLAGSWALRGDSFELTVPDRPARPGEDAVVTLMQSGTRLSVLGPSAAGAPKVRLFLRFHPARKATTQTYELGQVEVRKDGLYFRQARMKLELLARGRLPGKALVSGVYVRVNPGDAIRTPAQIGDNFQPRVGFDRTTRGALVGAAWVKRNWVLAYDPDPIVPWARHLAHAASAVWRLLGREAAARQYGVLTLDPGLQAAAQEFISQKGRLRHQQLLKVRGPREALPPRLALAILDLPSGEALALGGWPRMNSGRYWLPSAEGDIPTVEWVEGRAPKSLRRRYAGDRNFDRMIMGSSTKPVLASAVLAVHKRLDRLFAVTGGGGREAELFGIPITPGWRAPVSRGLAGGRWCDFKSYLANSDNRYNLRFCFLGLALPGKENTIDEDGVSPSASESMSSGASEWRRYPKFPAEIAFSHAQPGKMQRLDGTDWAKQLSRLYNIGVQRGDVTRRFSFWTGDESDDRPSQDGKPRPWRDPFLPISPEAPQFALDRIERPRTLVSLLLGGDENMWANADFAAAFGSCVLGRPVMGHAARGARVHTDRPEFRDIAGKLRPALELVVTSGTAASRLRKTGGLQFLSSLPGYKAYAKTGTLAESEDRPDVSRVVLAIVNWDTSGNARRGVVLSLVVERGYLGLATEWLGEFLSQYGNRLRSVLSMS